MATPPGRDAQSWKTQFQLAKLLLIKYGALHSFHELQLENYPVACCKISIDGMVEFDIDKRLVAYHIKTSRFFYKNGSETKERHKWSLIGKWKVSAKEYAEEQKQAFINLETWTRELLWPDTKVSLYVDGKPYKESSFN